MKTELRECPYCNGSNLEVWDSGDGKYPDLLPSVECKDCGIMQHLSHWNTRPIEDGLRAEIEALQKELDELKEQYRWHSLEKDGLPELNQDVQLWSYAYREIRIGHFYDYEEGNETSPDIWFDDYDRYECFRLDELPKKYQWRYLNAPKEGE